MAMICPVCRSGDFYEDEGGFYCARCNTQSQELFAESFDLEEDNDLYLARGVGGAISRTKKGITRRQQKVAAEEVSEATVADCLEVYQSSLRMLVHEVGELTQSPDLDRAVRSLWASYLEAWRCSGCSIGPAFVSSFGQEYEDDFLAKATLPHPPIPTKQLLLGFLNLALRQQSSWATSTDLVRWSVQGYIPYANLFEIQQLPSELVAKIGTRSLFLHNTDLGRPSATNIMFHTYLLAETLQIRLPPLNAPLVARAMIASLGLPLSCWSAYCGVSQLFSSATPLRSLDPEALHYPEHVMAACVVAIKLQRNWMEWSYAARPGDGEATLPLHLVELDLIRRRDLDLVLNRIRRSVRRAAGNDYGKSHNAAVAAFFRGSPDLWEGLLSTDETVKASSAEAVVSSTSVVEATLPFVEDKTVTKLRVGRENVLTSAQYLVYDETDDSTGLVHPQYAVMLERCARHVCTSPGLLHVLVQRVDAELAAVLSEIHRRDVHDSVENLSSKRTERLRARLVIRNVRRRRFKRSYVKQGIERLRRLRTGARFSATRTEKFRAHVFDSGPTLMSLGQASIDEPSEPVIRTSAVEAPSESESDYADSSASAEEAEALKSPSKRARRAPAGGMYHHSIGRRRAVLRETEFRLPPAVVDGVGASVPVPVVPAQSDDKDVEEVAGRERRVFCFGGEAQSSEGEGHRQDDESEGSCSDEE